MARNLRRGTPLRGPVGFGGSKTTRARARRRPLRHRLGGDAQRLPARPALAADARAHLALLQERDRDRAAHPGRRLPLQEQRAGAVPRHAGAAAHGPHRAQAGAGNGARRPSHLHPRRAGDRLEPEARELRAALHAPPRRRGRPRHARPGSEHPHPGVRPAAVSHRHPHRARARARPAHAGAGVHRRVVQPLPALLPARRRAAMGPRQGGLRHRGAGVRLRPDHQVLRQILRKEPAKRKKPLSAPATCSASGRACCA